MGMTKVLTEISHCRPSTVTVEIISANQRRISGDLVEEDRPTLVTASNNSKKRNRVSTTNNNTHDRTRIDTCTRTPSTTMHTHVRAKPCQRGET